MGRWSGGEEGMGGWRGAHCGEVRGGCGAAASPFDVLPITQPAPPALTGWHAGHGAAPALACKRVAAVGGGGAGLAQRTAAAAWALAPVGRGGDGGSVWKGRMQPPSLVASIVCLKHNTDIVFRLSKGLPAKGS